LGGGSRSSWNEFFAIASPAPRTIIAAMINAAVSAKIVRLNAATVIVVSCCPIITTSLSVEGAG
jgi:hypothetical protein